MVGGQREVSAMAAQGSEAETEWANEVRLVGRVSAAPQESVMPSGDVMLAFRVVVPRAPGGRSRQRVDALDCVAWLAAVRRSVGNWAVGDVVEVHGPVRRRFYRGAGGAVSRVEVEVKRVKRVSKVRAA